MAGALATAFHRNAPAVANLGVRFQDLLTSGAPGIAPGMKPGQIYERIKSLQDSDYVKAFAGQPADKLEDARESAALFRKDYDKIQTALLAAVIEDNVEVSIRQIAASEVKYLEKYAAADLGALWIPRINQFRLFALLNIYAGPVELTPSAPLSRAGWKPFLKERLSLATGYSLKDISSVHDSKIRGNNAWIYGLGFRVNRYFRIAAGGTLYRGASQSSGLRNDFFIGPSADLTAIEYFKNIFSKVK